MEEVWELELDGEGYPRIGVNLDGLGIGESNGPDSEVRMAIPT